MTNYGRLVQTTPPGHRARARKEFNKTESFETMGWKKVEQLKKKSLRMGMSLFAFFLFFSLKKDRNTKEAAFVALNVDAGCQKSGDDWKRPRSKENIWWMERSGRWPWSRWWRSFEKMAGKTFEMDRLEMKPAEDCFVFFFWWDWSTTTWPKKMNFADRTKNTGD